MEAITDGYSEAIASTSTATSRSSGQNIFLVRDNVVHTPPIASSFSVE